MAHPGRPHPSRRHAHLARAGRRVREVCTDALTTDELVGGLLGPFDDALGLSGMIVGATDPGTAVVSTSTLVKNLPQAMAVPWMRNEAFEDDFNKFAALHRTAAGPTTLHRATQGNPQLSPRYRLNLRTGFGPEMRVTFSSGPDCWGMAGLVRESGEPDFDDESVAWVEDLRPDIVTGLRRTMTFGAPSACARAPGVVTFDPEGVVTTMTTDARRLLDDLWMCPIEGLDHTLPGEAYMVATIARAHGQGLAPSEAAKTRLRGRSGQWITVRGDAMFTTDGEPAGVALVIEQSHPLDVLPLVLASYGLTVREREVFTEMTHGQTAREIAARLFISEHTVRDHLKSILAKTGTGSRGELMGLLFQHRT